MLNSNEYRTVNTSNFIIVDKQPFGIFHMLQICEKDSYLGRKVLKIKLDVCNKTETAYYNSQ